MYALTEIVHSNNFTFIALNETQLFQCDAPLLMSKLGGHYRFFLNSDDLYDDSLPSVRNSSYGGTMLLWRTDIDPYVQIIEPSTPAFLTAIFKPPGLATTAHISIYMPTHGKEIDFIADLAELRNSIDNLNNIYDYPTLFIRGDSNCNPNNKQRYSLWQQFLKDYDLHSVQLGHSTYHHFLGSGLYDSSIDVILHSKKYGHESLTEIVCRHDNPTILSKHDMITSVAVIPICSEGPELACELNISAPKIHLTRHKILWSPEGVSNYESLVGQYLLKARDEWFDPQSESSMSVLLNISNQILDIVATKTNKHIAIGHQTKQRKKGTPRPIKTAINRLNRTCRKYFFDKQRLKQAKKKYRNEIRVFNNKESFARDQRMAEILSNKPGDFFRYLSRQRRAQPSHIEKLMVGDKVYLGDTVCDGFYDSMANLKSCDFDSLFLDPKLSDKQILYENIMKLCENNQNLPPISIEDSTKLLKRMKKDVRDLYGVTALHYLHAGQPGLQYFNFILNSIISDVNFGSLIELNSVHGLILHKGHNKDRSNHRSYRTISTCPFLSKCIDLYIRDLYVHLWEADQADTQFQGKGSNHELASLLVTEIVQHSLFVAKKPVYLLALDAQSAFDRCIPHILISQLYRLGVPGAAVNFLNNRFRNRKTVYEWDGILMGPADDDIGVEQGGINSSDLYKIYNNRQLKDAQESGLGVDLDSCTVAAVGQADDVLLASNDVYELQLLCRLTQTYCDQNNVILEPAKTQLLPLATPDLEQQLRIAELTNNISISGVSVPFTDRLEHVGIIRDKNGNMAHILHRIAQHKKSIASILFAGAAKSHRGNPAASLRLHNLYCLPVLLSGLGSLVLSKVELDILEQHFTKTLLRIQRLHDKTPRSYIHLMAGALPFSALLAIRRLSLFYMICLKPDSPLYQHAKYVLTFATTGSRSWFLQIRDTCQQYGLDPPLEVLANTPSKCKLKKLAKLKITEYWQQKFTEECSTLSSLKYFDSKRASLLSPHPNWKFAGGNPYEVHKSLVVAKMLSGRYRTESLLKYWTNNSRGICSMTTCINEIGYIEHMLLLCPALQHVRRKMFIIWERKLNCCVPLYQLFLKMSNGSRHDMVSFLLNPCANPDLISLAQTFGERILENSLYLTRTYVYAIHREKLILTGKLTT